MLVGVSVGVLLGVSVGVFVGFDGSLIPNAIPTTLIIDQEGKIAVRISGEVTVAGLKKMLDKVLAND